MCIIASESKSLTFVCAQPHRSVIYHVGSAPQFTLRVEGEETTRAKERAETCVSVFEDLLFEQTSQVTPTLLRKTRIELN